MDRSQGNTLLIVNGERKSAPPCNRKPHGVCRLSRWRVTLIVCVPDIICCFRVLSLRASNTNADGYFCCLFLISFFFYFSVVSFMRDEFLSCPSFSSSLSRPMPSVFALSSRRASLGEDIFSHLNNTLAYRDNFVTKRNTTNVSRYRISFLSCQRTHALICTYVLPSDRLPLAEFFDDEQKAKQEDDETRKSFLWWQNVRKKKFSWQAGAICSPANFATRRRLIELISVSTETQERFVSVAINDHH